MHKRQEVDPDREAEPTEAVRVRRFLTFFKGYMSLSTLIVAALPVPVTMLEFIPTYAAHTKLLSVYTSLFSFLLVAFVFYSRHSLAQWFFPALAKNGKTLLTRFVAALPFLFICLSLTLLFAYQYTLQESLTKDTRIGRHAMAEILFKDIRIAKEKGLTDEETSGIYLKHLESMANFEELMSMEKILKRNRLQDVPYSLTLIGLYLGFFLATEAAFVLMALREYLQDLLGISDEALIKGGRRV